MAKKNFKNRNKGNTNGGSDSQANGKANNSNANGNMIFKFAPMTSDRSTKYATFDRIKEKIEIQIQKEYEGRDITRTIRHLKKVDIKKTKPKREVSIDPDPKVEDEENKNSRWSITRHLTVTWTA